MLVLSFKDFCACMFVCLSVMSLRLKCTGLHIVYEPFWHVPLMMQSHVMEVKDLEDRRRHQNESRAMKTVN